MPFSHAGLERSAFSVLRQEAESLKADLKHGPLAVFYDADSDDDDTQKRAFRELLSFSKEVKEGLLLRFKALQGGLYSSPPSTHYSHSDAAAPAQAATVPDIGDASPTAETGPGRMPCAAALGRPRTLLGVLTLLPSNSFLQAWIAFILLLDATYTAFWVPIAITFELSPSITSVPGTFDFIAGCILCLDIVLRFNSCIMLRSVYKSLLLTHPKTIAAFYVWHGSFLADVVTVVPLLVLPLAPDIDETVRLGVLLLRLLRLVRVHRVVRKMLYLQMMSEAGSKAWHMVLGTCCSLLFLLLVMCNFMACAWIYAGREGLKDGRGWLAFEYKFQGESNVAACESYSANVAQGVDGGMTVDCSALFFAADSVYIYWIAFYFVLVTLTSIGYGDITPSSPAEIGMAMLITFSGLATFAVIIGSMVEVVNAASSQARKAAAVRSKLIEAQHWMEVRNLSTATRKRIIEYVAEDWSKALDLEDAGWLRELPMDVASDAIWDMVHDDLERVPLLSELEVQGVKQSQGGGFEWGPTSPLKVLASTMVPVNTTRGLYVARQGEEADCIFFLQRGEVEVLHVGVCVAVIRAPAVFGESALLKDDLQAAQKWLSGYRTTRTSMIWKLPTERINGLALIMPGIKDKLLTGVKKTVTQKLLRLAPVQQKLVRLFLASLHADSRQCSDEERRAMMAGLLTVLDMSLVQILAHFELEDDHGRSLHRSQRLGLVPHASVPGGLAPQSRCSSASGSAGAGPGAPWLAGEPHAGSALGREGPGGEAKGEQARAARGLWGIAAAGVLASPFLDRADSGGGEGGPAAARPSLLNVFEDTLQLMRQAQAEQHCQHKHGRQESKGLRPLVHFAAFAKMQLQRITPHVACPSARASLSEAPVDKEDAQEAAVAEQGGHVPVANASSRAGGLQAGVLHVFRADSEADSHAQAGSAELR